MKLSSAPVELLFKWFSLCECDCTFFDEIYRIPICVAEILSFKISLTQPCDHSCL